MQWIRCSPRLISIKREYKWKYGEIEKIPLPRSNSSFVKEIRSRRLSDSESSQRVAEEVDLSGIKIQFRGL